MNIKHPGLALLIVFVMAAALDVWGLHDGSFMIWDLIGGVFFYRLFTVQR